MVLRAAERRPALFSYAVMRAGPAARNGTGNSASGGSYAQTHSKRGAAVIPTRAAHRIAATLTLAYLGLWNCRLAGLAWGYSGHVLINAAAAAAFPDELPGFLRTLEVTQIIGELGPQLDRSKDAGNSPDADRDLGHYLDLGDDGSIAGGPALSALPPAREGYVRRHVDAIGVRANIAPLRAMDGSITQATRFARANDLRSLPTPVRNSAQAVRSL